MYPNSFDHNFLEDVPVALRSAVLPWRPRVRQMEEDAVLRAEVLERLANKLAALVCNDDEPRAEVSHPMVCYASCNDLGR
eukprot:2224602-Pyramimonas_sp.AAC.1